MTEQEILERTDDAAPEQTQPALPDEPYYRPTPQQSSGAARLGALLVIIGLIWLTIELVGYGPFFGASQRNASIAAPLPGNRLELDLGAGDVEIRTATAPAVQVELTQHGIWQGDPLAISQSNDRVLVRNEAHSSMFGLCFGRCGQSYEISVPAGVHLLVHTSSGDISVAGATGQVELASSSGEVTARDIANGVSITSSSGDVRLSQIGGRLEVQTSSGDIELEQGRVVDANVQTSSGDIELDGVAGTLALESNSGDLKIRDGQNGRLDIRTDSGEVDYSGGLAGDSSITTSSGDVTLHLPANSSFVLDASTSSGDLENDFQLRNEQQSEQALSGSAGEGGATLKIATGSGGVSIKHQ